MRSITSPHSHFIAPALPQAGNAPLPPPAEAPLIRTKTQVWVDDGNVRTSRVLIEGYRDPARPDTLEEIFLLETGGNADRIHIGQHANGQVYAHVNERYYAFPTGDAHSPVRPLLHIKAGGGDDRITIDPNVSIAVRIDAGDGDDTVQAGGGYTSVYGGRGNDHIRLGDGVGYAEGNEGDDTIAGGSGHAVMYGNNGNDRLYAGSGPAGKYSHLDGGAGEDQLYAGSGHTVLNGGLGNDRMVGHDDTTFYTGEGHDTVRAEGRKARIHAKTTDRLFGAEASIITPLTPSQAGRQAFNIQGSPEFKQRVDDDLALLRASPQGQKMLEALDQAALRNGSPVDIVQTSEPNNTYDFWSTELQKLEEAHQHPDGRDDPRLGYIKEGVAGSRADKATIFYNPAHIYGNDTPSMPLVQLYHEMAHAWNGANGTFLPGMSDPSDRRPVPNDELQAVGLATSASPFDFDNDPSTPPTSTNQAPFTENTLNKEMGKPLRTRYS